MVTRPIAARHQLTNAKVIAAEFDWLETIIDVRFLAYGGDGGRSKARGEAMGPPPPLDGAKGPYAALVRDMDLGAPERLILALALIPYLAPERLDSFLIQNAATGRRFTEFGGILGEAHAGFLPTVETAMFLLTGRDLGRRMTLDRLFTPDHPLARRGILIIEQRRAEEPSTAGVLRLSAPGLHLLLHGDGYAPAPGLDFPATRLVTPLDWHDLVLDPPTMRQVAMIGLWIEHAAMLMQDWGLARRLRPGYRALFHGPPGTGKTLTASLLGKRYKLPVYRVDLSQVVSKWIGETEKNLATLFDQAENRDWILFFDEADALFGKRGESQTANDRAANQQIAYLLQRLEVHPGIAILATNQSAHLDDAFARRFQTTILFPVPDVASRTRLWRESFAARGFT
ncbi:MAG: ATP-binding protein, partial [Acetobacteraceae bacterium]